MTEDGAARPGPQDVGVVDRVAAGQRRVDQRHRLVAHIGVPRRRAQIDVLLEQALQSEVFGQGGTLVAAEGTPVADLRGLMGHASLATTQGYVDSVARDRQAAAAANPALRHLRAPQGR